LSEIPDLRVAGRTSSFSFKGKNADLREIGDRLGVRTVLEGSVRRAGKRVRITAQLINVTDGYHLWSARYDREIEDVFAVQDEIAAAIAERMKATLGSGRAAVLEQRATESIEAYEAYLKGRALLYRRGQATKQGMALMEKALSLDPNYGLAWAGLADGYTILGYMGHLSPEDASERARNAADRALEAAPDLAEAHSARAMVRLMFDWDFRAAEEGFKRAIELNPGYVQGMCWYYIFYLGFACQRWSETFRGLHELQTVEPLSGYLAAVLAVCLHVHGEADEAARWSVRAIELDPTAFLAIWSRQLAFHRRGDWGSAIAEADAVLAASGRHVFALHTLAATHAENGEIEDARAVYDELHARSRREPISSMALAAVAAAAGERAAAIAHARDAISRHDPAVVMYSKAWPQSRFLRDLPEFDSLLRSVGFPS
jgi:tetratricopeptide (TPR) repeat protein